MQIFQPHIHNILVNLVCRALKVACIQMYSLRQFEPFSGYYSMCMVSDLWKPSSLKAQSPISPDPCKPTLVTPVPCKTSPL